MVAAMESIACSSPNFFERVEIGVESRDGAHVRLLQRLIGWPEGQVGYAEPVEVPVDEALSVEAGCCSTLTLTMAVESEIETITESTNWLLVVAGVKRIKTVSACCRRCPR